MIILYRGDSIPTLGTVSDKEQKYKDFLTYVLSDGLMTRSFGTGKLSDLNNSLCELVSHHCCKLETYERSVFLSFTTSEETANAFMSTENNAEFQICSFQEASHFIWKLELKDLSPVKNGVFSYTYVENVDNFQRHSPSVLTQRGFDPKALATYIVHQKIKEEPRKHSALVIDVNTFLKTCNLNNPNVKQAIQSSEHEKEWLIFPTDPLAGGGFEGRLFLSKNLSIHDFCKKV